ncbi:hypothetical protein EVAR_37453_1 [Eumeta japonica]|uniref:Uncharacterized protein n=1 Tax=Eumeta variegata TaxID=151549 RepID=A0A4C1X6A0_EUMVA|nr:hypothetical protein EVAR_37453_1 [Eumeta japonica]
MDSSVVSDWSYSRGGVCQLDFSLREPLLHLPLGSRPSCLERNESYKFEKRVDHEAILETFCYLNQCGQSRAEVLARRSARRRTTQLKSVGAAGTPRRVDSATRLSTHLNKRSKIKTTRRIGAIKQRLHGTGFFDKRVLGFRDKITYISAYTPIKDTSDEGKEQFYEEQQKTGGSIPKYNEILRPRGF